MTKPDTNVPFLLQQSANFPNNNEKTPLNNKYTEKTKPINSGLPIELTIELAVVAMIVPSIAAKAVTINKAKKITFLLTISNPT